MVVSPVFVLRARVTRKRKRGFPARAAGRAARVARRGRAHLRHRRGAALLGGLAGVRDPRVRLVRHLRVGVGGARWARAGSSSRIRLDCRAGTLSFFPTPSARRTGGRTRGRGRRAPGSPRARRVSTAGSRSRLPRGTRGSRRPRGARGASRERLARGDGRRVGGFASLRSSARGQARNPSSPRGRDARRPPSAPSASPRARLLRVRPRARSRSAGGSSRAPPRVRARRRACARGRARCSPSSNALPFFPHGGSFRSVRSQRPVLSRSGVGGRGSGSKTLRCSVWNFCVPSASARIGESANISSSFFRLRSGPR